MKRRMLQTFSVFFLLIGIASVFGMQLRTRDIAKAAPVAPQPPKKSVRIVTPDERLVLNKSLLREACVQDTKQVMVLLKAGADPEASDSDCGYWHRGFLHIVASWKDQAAIKNVLDHLKKTMAPRAFERLLGQNCSCNRKPYELAARNVWGPAVVHFFRATDNKDAHRAMLESDDLWHNAIDRGHVATLFYLLKCLKDNGCLREFLLTKRIGDDPLLHCAARCARDEVAVVVLSALDGAVDAATRAQGLALQNTQGLTVQQVAGSDAMRCLLALYNGETL